MIELAALSLFIIMITATLIMIIIAATSFFSSGGNHLILQGTSLPIIWETVFFATILAKISLVLLWKNHLYPKHYVKPVNTNTLRLSISFTILLVFTLGFAFLFFTKLSNFEKPNPKKIVAHRGLV